MVSLITVNMSLKTRHAIELQNFASHFSEHPNNSKEKETFSLRKSKLNEIWLTQR